MPPSAPPDARTPPTVKLMPDQDRVVTDPSFVPPNAVPYKPAVSNDPPPTFNNKHVEDIWAGTGHRPIEPSKAEENQVIAQRMVARDYAPQAYTNKPGVQNPGAVLWDRASANPYAYQQNNVNPNSQYNHPYQNQYNQMMGNLQAKPYEFMDPTKTPYFKKMLSMLGQGPSEWEAETKARNARVSVDTNYRLPSQRAAAEARALAAEQSVLADYANRTNLHNAAQMNAFNQASQYLGQERGYQDAQTRQGMNAQGYLSTAMLNLDPRKTDLAHQEALLRHQADMAMPMLTALELRKAQDAERRRYLPFGTPPATQLDPVAAINGVYTPLGSGGLVESLTTGTAAPGTAAPGTAAPGTAAPGTAAPGTAAPGTAAPGTAAPGTAAPGTAAPGTAAPKLPSPFLGGLTPGGTNPNLNSMPPVDPNTPAGQEELDRRNKFVQDNVNANMKGLMDMVGIKARADGTYPEDAESLARTALSEYIIKNGALVNNKFALAGIALKLHAMKNELEKFGGHNVEQVFPDTGLAYAPTGGLGNILKTAAQTSLVRNAQVPVLGGLPGLFEGVYDAISKDQLIGPDGQVYYVSNMPTPLRQALLDATQGTAPLPRSATSFAAPIVRGVKDSFLPNFVRAHMNVSPVDPYKAVGVNQ